MIEFKRAFEATGTTKKNHGYHDFYAQMLNGVDVDSILEIGVYLGQSLKAWKMIWPEATIEAVDYDMRFGADVAEQFNIYTFDSRSKESTDRYIKRQYDVVIDDGLHHWAAQLQTFDNFRRFAKKFYVIEDITGEYSQKMLLDNLPKDAIDRSTLFKAYGPTRTFRHGSYVEQNAQYRVLFIDLR